MSSNNHPFLARSHAQKTSWQAEELRRDTYSYLPVESLMYALLLSFFASSNSLTQYANKTKPNGNLLRSVVLIMSVNITWWWSILIKFQFCIFCIFQWNYPLLWQQKDMPLFCVNDLCCYFAQILPKFLYTNSCETSQKQMWKGDWYQQGFQHVLNALFPLCLLGIYKVDGEKNIYIYTLDIWQTEWIANSEKLCSPHNTPGD